MIVECPLCDWEFDDTYRSTICPHGTFLANDGHNNFAHHPDAHLHAPDRPDRDADRIDAIRYAVEHLARTPFPPPHPAGRHHSIPDPPVTRGRIAYEQRRLADLDDVQYAVVEHAFDSLDVDYSQPIAVGIDPAGDGEIVTAIVCGRGPNPQIPNPVPGDPNHETILNFKNFLSWGATPATPPIRRYGGRLVILTDQPLTATPVLFPVPPAWHAYVRGLTAYCPPAGTL